MIYMTTQKSWAYVSPYDVAYKPSGGSMETQNAGSKYIYIEASTSNTAYLSYEMKFLLYDTSSWSFIGSTTGVTTAIKTYNSNCGLQPPAIVKGPTTETTGWQITEMESAAGIQEFTLPINLYRNTNSQPVND